MCFEDEWFQAVIINENVFRNDSSSITAIEFQLVPSYNIITIELIGIFIPTNFMFECSNESRHNNLLNKNTVIIPAMHQNNNSIKFDILGLLENTIYQCCLTRMSSSESSVIPSITTKCKLVKTLSNTEMTASSGVTTIILGALLGTVVILTLCTTFFICLHKIIKCRGRYD